jgi:MFS-type transporter involved in bile tolerance (Atg22 family)
MSSMTMFQFPVLFCAMLYVLWSTPLFLILPRISEAIHGSACCLIFISLYGAMSSSVVWKCGRNFSHAY